MKSRWLRLLLIVVGVVAFPFASPAPLVYRPGEGWVYEPVGGEARWRQSNASNQLAVAQIAFDRKDYGLAIKASRRVVQEWPLSDYAPRAQYLVGRSYEAKGYLEKAFAEYQNALDKSPKTANYQELVQRQFEIANKFLAGKRFRLWGFLPFSGSMERTAMMYEKIVRNGKYSEVAPQAQLNIGEAHERDKALGLFKTPDYPAAIEAYKIGVDRYFDRPKVAAEALFRAGLAYSKESQTAEYDQTTAGQAIATFTDFIALYPEEPRVAQAQKIIATLRAEQARGNFEIAKFYESKHKWEGAKRYYNAAFNADPNSPYAIEAQRRIYALNQKTQPAGK
jgi:outer membrane assembly lipoprotein YfiO